MQRTRAAALAVCAMILAGCGGAVRPHATPPPADRQWMSNAGNLIDQLRGDVVLTWNAGGTLPEARRALGNDSDLYALLLAYTDFGGCGKMLSGLGSPSTKLTPVKADLVSACGHLERASTLFTRSAKNTDPKALLAATRQALEAKPILYRAGFQLAAARL